MAENRKEIAPRLSHTEPIRRCDLEECRATCCYDGVWVDSKEAAEIVKQKDLIAGHMRFEYRDHQLWFDGRKEDDPHVPGGEVLHTTVLPNSKHPHLLSCIFLRQDYKCALQVAGEESGQHPWTFKPFYCILHPLDLDDQGRITLDKTELLLDDDRSCLRPSDRKIPLKHTFIEELDYLGEKRDGSGI